MVLSRPEDTRPPRGPSPWREYPAATACFEDDLGALLAIHRVPVRHRIRVRTTNLAERSFVEERRRTKVIGRFSDEHAAMKLVFATMIRAAERWCRVSISDLERHQLTLLRTELGIDPPPGGPATSARPPGATAPQHDHQAADLQDAQDLTSLDHPALRGNPGNREPTGHQPQRTGSPQAGRSPGCSSCGRGRARGNQPSLPRAVQYETGDYTAAAG